MATIQPGARLPDRAPAAKPRPADKPKPTSAAPAGKKWVPTYGHWRPTVSSPYQRYIAGWHLGAATSTGTGGGAGGGAAVPEIEPAAPSEAAPPTPAYDATKDWWYMGERARMEREQSDKAATATGKITSLTTKGADGLTEYGRRRADLDREFQLSARGMVDQMAKAGLLRSGRRNRETGDLARGLFQSDQGLQDEYGTRAIERAQTERDGYQVQLRDMLASLAREGEQRFVSGGGTYGYGG